MKKYPKIGIRPTIDGRQGGVRESLEEKTMAKNHTKRELTNGYKIRRGAIDHNIPLITNARLA